MKKSFVLYTDIYESIKHLSKEEKGNLLDAIFEFTMNDKTPKLSPETQMAFSFIKNSLKRDAEKWDKIRKQRKAAGSLGGKARVANQANATFAKQIKQDQANQAVSVSVNDSVSVNATFDNQLAWDKFSPSCIEEINLTDPVVIDAARTAFINKSTTPTERAVRIFLKNQVKFTPPDEFLDKNAWDKAFEGKVIHE